MCYTAIIPFNLVLNICGSQPKSQPKSAAATKANTANSTNSSGRAGRRGRGGRPRNPRPAKKTAEELDSEMADYFDNGGIIATDASAATNGVAQPAANGDVMEDEVLVSLYEFLPSLLC